MCLHHACSRLLHCRFRERQKAKLQDLHKQIDELTHKVMSLQTENSSLHSRTSILEKVLDMRNEQIQVMQETREVSSARQGRAELGRAGQDCVCAAVPLWARAVSR
jgi:hypothetical protein